VLTIAALGMLGYGLYSVGYGVADLVAWRTYAVWANLAVILFGLLLMLAAAFVRAMTPGGLALALGALLGLQGFSLVNSLYLHGTATLAPEIARGIFASALILLAYFGEREHERHHV
jgi:hypothetical protein